MDIVCGKCGMHFSSVEAAREHTGHCRATSVDETVHWLPSEKSKLSSAEWDSLMKLVKSSATEPAASEPAALQTPGWSEVNKVRDSAELDPKKVQPAQETKHAKPKSYTSPNRGSRKNQDGKAPHVIGTWFLALLVVFIFSIVGVVLSIALGISSPLFILLGLSIIFSIERWFYYSTVKRSVTSRPYKLFLNFFLLYMLAVTFWSGMMLFSKKLEQDPLAGSIILVSELSILILIYRVLQKHRKRWPSMKLTVLGVSTVILILAFAGVEPLSTYKGDVLNWLSRQYSTFTKSVADFIDQATPTAITPSKPSQTPVVPIKEPGSEDKTAQSNAEFARLKVVADAERTAFDLINSIRVNAGLNPTLWDDDLYKLSREHTQEMSNRKQLFHSEPYSAIGENAWGGSGFVSYSASGLAQAIVSSWMSSPLHRAWMLNESFQHSVVSIISNSSGQYASWTFWVAEAGDGPPLVRKASAMWESETGGRIPWLTWLYEIKGYPDNQDFLRQLGIK